jgi:hypothetical protein
MQRARARACHPGQGAGSDPATGTNAEPGGRTQAPPDLFPFYPHLSTRIRARQPYPCLHVGDHTLASNRHPSVTLLPLPNLARASNSTGEAPAARHCAPGDFSLWFLCSPPGGERERRGEGGRGKRNRRARRHRVALPGSGTLELEPDVWQRRPSTRGWRPKQRSSSRHHLHHRGLHGHVFTSASA